MHTQQTWAAGSCLIGSFATESLAAAWVAPRADLDSIEFLEPARTLKPLWALASLWPATTLPSLAAVLPDAFPAFIIMISEWTVASDSRGRSGGVVLVASRHINTDACQCAAVHTC